MQTSLPEDPRPTLGSWRAASTDLDEWLQLSFSRRVRAESVTIGSTHCYHPSAVHELIQRYVLEYSDDSLYWYRYSMPMYHYRVSCYSIRAKTTLMCSFVCTDAA